VAKIKRISIEENEDVYDITVEKNHNFFANGILVHNCVEIGMWPMCQNDDGSLSSGIQFCNLTEINGKKAHDEESFIEACKAAAILGTIQAGYTTFPYLGEVTEKITRREALLGVSITGMMDNPEVLFSEQIQRRGAREVKKWNKITAQLLNINPAARTTCIKPSGSACVGINTPIKTSKGIMTMGELFSHYDFFTDEQGAGIPIVDESIQVYDENNELKNIEALFCNGFQQTYTIEFEDGTTYEFTADHKLKTMDGWKLLSDLTEDDDVIDFGV